MRTALVDQAIDTAAITAEVASTANGAMLVFVGTVREVNEGRAVTGIEYTAYRSMAARELADIASEAAARFNTRDIVIEHRLGELGLGEASVVIAIGHARRGETYDASRYVIEQLKKRVPIWKLEHYVDGTREWVNAGTGKRHEESEVR
jgi:molybdopterin synthase catalytic subunit